MAYLHPFISKAIFISKEGGRTVFLVGYNQYMSHRGFITTEANHGR